MTKATIREIRTKSGEIIPVGERFYIRPCKESDRVCSATRLTDNKEYHFRWDCFFKVPSQRTIEKWVMDTEYPRTVLGKKIEPDGRDENGFPSWMLALGII